MSAKQTAVQVPMVVSPTRPSMSALMLYTEALTMDSII